jgi:aspartyl-tRNA(Asn)/glutamyl-tRNA(Gln) amidotransferase subunit A
VGVPREYQIEGMDPEIVALWHQGGKWLEEAGATLVPVSLPHTSYALPVYYVVAPAEASSNLARYDGVRYGLREKASTLDALYSDTRDVGFGAEVKRRLLMGTYVLSHTYYDAYYIQAQRVRRLILNDFINAFQDVDLILTPSAPTPPFPIGAPPQDPVVMYLNDVFTVPASLGGLPAISVPAALSGDQLPLGLQLVGRSFDEETVLKAAYVLEQAAAFAPLPLI